MSVARLRPASLLLFALGLASFSGASWCGNELAREILEELVEIPTTPTSGKIPEAVDAMAGRLRAAGFPSVDVRVLGFEPELANLIVRYRGTGNGKGAVLLLAHMDVVDVDRENWSTDPFRLVEQDGYFYGRGSHDNKAAVAALVATFIRLHEEGFKPERDLILLVTADEETTGASIEWMLKEQRALVDAEFAFNSDTAEILIDDGRPIAFEVQASEKVYMTLALEVTNPGGHSSRPRQDNAIYQLSAALTRLAAYQFPVQLSEITRGFFQRSAEMYDGPKSAAMAQLAAGTANAGALALLEQDDFLNALMRTTCVATRVTAGHANNALPQTARAIVNCRVLPEDSPVEVQEILRRVVDDAAISMTMVWAPVASPPSPLSAEIIDRVQTLVDQLFGGIPIIPVMTTGATDGLYLRNAGIPTYGISALAEDPDGWRIHGRDERVGVQAFYDSVEFWYRLAKGL
jgi:acetylornithine deacetylase/succinyl-diaminopimelate desuccinylase-like protein